MFQLTGDSDGGVVAPWVARYLRLLTRLRPLFRVSAAAEIHGPENVAVQYDPTQDFLCRLDTGIRGNQTTIHNSHFTDGNDCLGYITRPISGDSR